jgi:thiol-disulfide isomerase/thioredoxin
MLTLRNGTWLGQVPLVDRPSLGAGSQDIPDSGFSQVLAAPKAIVDFWSPGCPHCVAFKPFWEAAANQNADILFAAVNVDNYVQNAGTYGVRALPTIVFFANGKEVNRVEGGFESQADFQREIQKAFSGGGTSPQGLSVPAGMPGTIVQASSSVTPYVIGGVALAGVLGTAGYLAWQFFKK